jgi:hypothetical protein
MSTEALAPFNLQAYLADPSKLRDRVGITPTFQAYNAKTDTLHLEWPAEAELYGVVVQSRIEADKGTIARAAAAVTISQDELRRHLALATSVPTVSYGVALMSNAANNFYVVMAEAKNAIELEKSQFFKYWLVPVTTVQVQLD